MDCRILGSEFEFQSGNYIHFQTNTRGERYETPYLPCYGLNNINAVHLQGWHYITYKGSNAIKQRNRSPSFAQLLQNFLKKIFAGEFQRDTPVSFIFIGYLDSLRRTSIDLIKENGFRLKKAISGRYHKENITWADYVKDLEASCKYTCSSRNSATSPRVSRKVIFSLRKLRKKQVMNFN